MGRETMVLPSYTSISRSDITLTLFHTISRHSLTRSLITGFISITAGLLIGIGFSKLAELGFRKIIGRDSSYRFIISGQSVGFTVIVYGFIFFLIFLNAARQVRFSKTINLINSDKAGEKPPKANWFVGILGLLFLIAGYVLALKIEQPLSALLVFFAAVILVIIGTYLVLIAGSVLLCRILQKNKRYYYKTNHFVSVSSMAYRMKRNGAGLASICILLTMILVMMSSTSALYLNREETLNDRYPRQINCSACNYGFSDSYGKATGKVMEGINRKTEEFGASVKNSFCYDTCYITGYFNDGRIHLDIDPVEMFDENPLANMTSFDYDKVVQVSFFDVDDYNRLTGSNESLSSGEVLAFVGGNLNIGDELKIGDESFKVSKKIGQKKGNFKYAFNNAVVTSLAVIADDLGDIASRYNKYTEKNGNKMLIWEWHYVFDIGMGEDKELELNKQLKEYVREELYQNKFFAVRCESRAFERNDFVETFGGLFFLGILLSVIFLVSCVLIIYYKQISEGFEDKSRFGIMQKVGMTRENIKKSINSQMLTVFLIPILFACMHLAAVLPIINKLLQLFGHYNMPLLLICAGSCVLICGIFYAVIYKLTSNAYYRIVS